MSHPLQALALITTLAERFGETLPGRTLAWLGDGSNLQLDLLSACAMLGVNVRVARAEGRAPQVEELERAAQVAAQRGANVQVENCALTAVRGADVVVTDRGVTEGVQTGGNEYQVTAEMMATAAEGAVFLHGTPCGRGEEVSEEVYYSPRSLVLQAAENHMWVCMAVCMPLLGLPWEED
jgi:ornithine carbamoyltransferase